MISRMRFPGLILLATAACNAAQLPAPEVTATPATAVFRSSTSLVSVPVVVRDGKGVAVGSLHAEDFRLFDNGKLQTISKFSIEKFEANTGFGAAAPKQDSTPPPAAAIAVQPLPDRFVAYFFDDIHMDLADLARTRTAAIRQIDSSEHARDRVAIFTASGRQTTEFSADREKLHAALMAITVGQSGAEFAMAQSACPHVDYYMGDQIYNKHDAEITAIAVAEAIQCGFRPDTAERVAENAARAAVLNGDTSTETTLTSLRYVVNRMAAMPGQRTLMLISPGFLVLDNKHDEETGLIERAIRANAIIGGLDARGLYTTSADAGERDIPSPAKVRLKNTEAIAVADVIADLADGTGGAFYHGTNDYDEGFNRVAATPEYIYLLAFSPIDLKYDGKRHQLKVTLPNQRGLTIQARAGYFADNHPEDPADEVRHKIQDAFFSNQELRDLPVTLQAEFFKDGDDATVTVNARVDASKLPFHKEDGRNRDDLTLVVGLFDQNGNFISALQKTIELRLKDETLPNWVRSGIQNSTDFNVKPGKYLVRLVVRDSGGEAMAEQSTGLEIPW